MKSATVPLFLRIFYPSLLWWMPAGNKRLYLTFDDGPHPVVTPQVLDILAKYDARATFFCIGKNVEKHPEVYHEILAQGHRTGNHSYHHINGWQTSLKVYYENAILCRNLVDSTLFRPPYGRITPSQIQTLKKEFTIVMWSVLSYDFDHETSPGQCIDYVLNNTKDGAIIVFHDSKKAAPNLLKALPVILPHFSKLGYSFETL